MKRAGIVLLLFAAVLLTGNSNERTDVADLLPVEVIRLQLDEASIIIETDEAGCGKGETFDAAIADLKKKAAGEVFLDTADYVLVEPDALYLIPLLKDVVRLSCQLCVEDGKVDINEVARYLKTHEPEASLLRYLTGPQNLPWLFRDGDDMRLVQSP